MRIARSIAASARRVVAHEQDTCADQRTEQPGYRSKEAPLVCDERFSDLRKYILTDRYLNGSIAAMPSSARRSHADRSTETRALLIQATVELLQSTGFAGATTARVAAQAGVTTGALHHHFATKGDLMFGVLQHASEQLRSRLERQDDVAVHSSGINAAQLVAHLWEVYGDPSYWAIWEIIIGTRSDEAFHRRVVSDRVSTMRSIIHPWVERQILSNDRKPEAVALFEFMLVAIRGLSLERFLDKDKAYFKKNLSLLAETVGQRFEQLTTTPFKHSDGKPTKARKVKA